MFYFEYDKPYVLVWPVIAVSLADEFWIEIGWLNCIAGWRVADGGDPENQNTFQERQT